MKGHGSTFVCLAFASSRISKGLRWSQTQIEDLYDVNQVDDESTFCHHDDDDMDNESIMMTLIEEGDEDANFVNDFEEQIFVACQESSELTSCFMAYQEARSRLREKARSHGFWPLSAWKRKGIWRQRQGIWNGKRSQSEWRLQHDVPPQDIGGSHCQLQLSSLWQTGTLET